MGGNEVAERKRERTRRIYNRAVCGLELWRAAKRPGLE
jgi:hypothetical protein